MNKFQKSLAVSALALMALSAQPAFSATDGTLGATSTGTSDVSLSIGSQYQISGLADLALGAYAGTGNMSGDDDVCVYTNDVTAAYNVRITDNSGMSAAGFSVQNGGATADIPFTVNWNDVAGTAGSSAVTYNTPLASTGANTAAANCGGSDNANFAVNMLQADLQAAPADSYATTLTIVIEP